MSFVVELVVLANSRRPNGRCIAGINRKTSQWIRPVGADGLGEVPDNLRKINGKEPNILDIVRMELEESAETYRFQMENRNIVNKPWSFVGKAAIADVLPYCCQDRHVFFNHHIRIPHSDLCGNSSWNSSLQLWEVEDFRCEYNEYKKWKGTFSIPSGDELSLSITDIDYLTRLNSGYKPGERALLLISLGGSSST